MEFVFFMLMLVFVAHHFQGRDERRRMALLSQHLGHYQIEKLMETLTDGYMRALGEPDATRQEQIWKLLASTEDTLSEQFNRFVAAFARVEAQQTRISKLPVSIFYTGRLLPDTTFDLRKALSIHAHGITEAVTNTPQRTPRDKAFTLLAELFLMQHTCHWFCKSKMVASARLMVRHKTPYAKVLESVAPDTRQAYCGLIAQ